MLLKIGFIFFTTSQTLNGLTKCQTPNGLTKSQTLNSLTKSQTPNCLSKLKSNPETFFFFKYEIKIRIYSGHKHGSDLIELCIIK
jgi:hypothetical protein